MVNSRSSGLRLAGLISGSWVCNHSPTADIGNKGLRALYEFIHRRYIVQYLITGGHACRRQPIDVPLRLALPLPSPFLSFLELMKNISGEDSFKNFKK